MGCSETAHRGRGRAANSVAGTAETGGKMSSARALALQVLSSLRDRAQKGRHRTATEILSEALVASNLSRREEGLATELVYSTLRRRLTLDWVIEKFSGVKVRRIERRLLDVLRLGVLQLVFMARVPEYAAVDESVKLARATGGKKASGFANSVLRKVAARASSIPFPEREEGIVEHIAIVHSHPRWLVGRWVERLGEDATISVCIANNAPPPMTARVNALKIDRDSLIEKMAEKEVQAVPREEDGTIEIVNSPKRLSDLQSFREGLFYLQDISATLPGKMLAPVAGEKVLDLCTAPGGKATHVAELLGNHGLVVACDIAEGKMSLLRENVERLGTSIVRPLVADGTEIDALLKPQFDRVLVDAPCSNTGVLRRRIEARWRLKEPDLKKLPKLQLDLLRSGCKVLKQGGVLVYSTCSIEREENQEVIGEFLRERGDFELEDEKEFLPKVGGGDGGYAAKMVKR